MKIRHVSLAALLTGTIVAACGSPMNVKAREDALRVELAKAQQMGGKDCAPDEYARSEAQLEFALLEIKQGDFIRAEDHLEEGFKAAKNAQRGVKNCSRVTIKTPTPTSTPVVVVKTP